jgi:hypothetical protein
MTLLQLSRKPRVKGYEHLMSRCADLAKRPLCAVTLPLILLWIMLRPGTFEEDD